MSAHLKYCCNNEDFVILILSKCIIVLRALNVTLKRILLYVLGHLMNSLSLLKSIKLFGKNSLSGFVYQQLS